MLLVVTLCIVLPRLLHFHRCLDLLQVPEERFRCAHQVRRLGTVYLLGVGDAGHQLD